MSKPEVVHCKGAPRDLGLDQGRAFAGRIRTEAVAVRPDGFFSSRLFELSSSRAARIRRDTLRYFPHMAERAMGLARGSGVGEVALSALLGRAFEAGEGGILGLGPSLTGGAPLIVRVLAVGEREAALRHSAPDTDFASVELVLPWRVPALCGVNEHGLAVASVATGGAARGRHAAPAVLLTQDVLQRFDAVEKAVEWLERRPAGGTASFVIADRSGALAAVDVAGDERTARGPANGVLTAGATADRERLAALVPSTGFRDRRLLSGLGLGPIAVLDTVRPALGTAAESGALDWVAPIATPREAASAADAASDGG